MEQGYNWVVYPYEFDLGLDEVGGSLTDMAQEGDQIIAYGGAFAEFSNGEWVHDNFTFQAGAGYMYYCNSEEDMIFEPYFNVYENTPACYQQTNPVKGEAFGAAKAFAPVWEVEQGRFADAMTVVVEIPGLTNADAWTLGAFVNGECRGQGHAVKDDIMFVGLMGKAGEKVTFRLHNGRTGEEFEVEESLTFTKKAGSVKAPVRMNAEGATGISSLNDNVKANDNAIYDLSGRRVAKPVKGIYVVGGKKVIY